VIFWSSLISPAAISYFFPDCQYACFFVNLVISYIPICIRYESEFFVLSPFNYFDIAFGGSAP
jgi:hypothetical protein